MLIVGSVRPEELVDADARSVRYLDVDLEEYLVPQHVHALLDAEVLASA